MSGQTPNTGQSADPESDGAGTENQQSVSEPPSISLPKGGAAMRSMGEKFSVNPATGTSSMKIPLPMSTARELSHPKLELSYDSGNGNGPFGLGWILPVQSISRKTDKGLPLYRDGGIEGDSDVFMLGSDDLVPVFKLDSEGSTIFDQSQRPVVDQVVHDGFMIQRYRPRVEVEYLRIERWMKLDDSSRIHWRTISKDAVVSVYGISDDFRIFDHTSDEKHIFSWLLVEVYDVLGNATIFSYKAENSQNVPRNAHEQIRAPETRATNRYLKTIRYGNRTPNRDSEQWVPFSALELPDLTWMFSVVFDYGEHDLDRPSLDQPHSWSYRQDSFSTYRAGFEIRTYRLCRRVLMFHHFSELPLTNYLVKSVDLSYDENPYMALLIGTTLTGWVHDPVDERYKKKSLPPIEFTYSQFPTEEALSHTPVHEIDPAFLQDWPWAVETISSQWIDLDGEGIPGLFAESSGVWRYKPNISTSLDETGVPDQSSNRLLSMPDLVDDRSTRLTIPRFDNAKVLSTKPITSIKEEHLQFVSLEANGQLEALSTTKGSWGFYEREAAEDTWVSYRTLKAFPNLNASDPQIKFVDLTGDGLADIFIAEDDVYTWHPSLGRTGFAAGSRMCTALDERQGPRVVFTQPNEAVYLADMTGDGLSDLMRLRNGEACYWPNLGYGRFGRKVTMDNSPCLDDVGLFNQKYVIIADIDGSGASDVLYIRPDGIDLYLNEAGNRFSDGKRLVNFPRMDHSSTVHAVDLMGTGTVCLVWTSFLSPNTPLGMRFMNVTGGIKPNLLTGYSNNMGAETRIHYATSSSFYMVDKLAGKQWATRIPFPVHCVKKIEIMDYISHHRFSTHYAYHEGFYDGREREFRGFAFVEHWDSEEFTANADDTPHTPASNENAKWSVPPVHTKTWYSVGAFDDGNAISQHMARHYFKIPEESGVATRSSDSSGRLLPSSPLPSDLSPASVQEAHRSLKGRQLRQEIYATDKTSKAELPYSILENNYTVKPVQSEMDRHNHGIFVVHGRESIAYQFERTLDDPRILHDLTLEVDTYGNVLKKINVAYGRMPGRTSLNGVDKETQERSLLSYTEVDVTNAVSDLEHHLTPRTAEVRSYQLHSIALPAGSRTYTWETFAADNLLLLKNLNNDLKQLFSKRRTLYRSDDLSQLLQVGQTGFMGLQGESYTLALTPKLLADTYRRPNTNGDIEQLMSSNLTEILVGDQGGYRDLDGDGNWWIPSGRAYFSQDRALPANQELVEARTGLFRERRFENAFGNSTVVDYDANRLLPVRTTDPVQNVSEAQYDYRTLQPALVIDINKNRAACAFDPLGNPMATAVIEKGGEDVGDNIDSVPHAYSDEQVRLFLENPRGAITATILGNASTVVIEDPTRFWRELDAIPKKPIFRATISRETHISSSTPASSSKLQVSFSYYDGFGQEFQKKIQADPGAVSDQLPGVISERWATTGWTIFNNKGKPTKKYEPFFDNSHHCAFDLKVGVCSTLLYDPLSRVVGTLHPNHTWTKTLFQPWEQSIYDEIDTGSFRPDQDPDVGNFFKLLPVDEYEPTWHNARREGQLGLEEQSAASKVTSYWDTPHVAYLDPLNRPFLTTPDNTIPGPSLATRARLDISGNILSITDALGRISEQNVYSLARNLLSKACIDAGKKWMLSDVSKSVIYSWDSRDQRFRYEFDEIRRPTNTYLQESPSKPEILIQKIVYGESQVDGHIHNVHGQIFQVFDQAGVESYVDYDFKGNMTGVVRKFAKEYKKILDWSHDQQLEDDTFLTVNRYDALSRLVEQKLPDHTLLRRIYNSSSQLLRVESRVEGGEGPDGSTEWTAFASEMQYNARGQRTLLRYGNGASTAYTYDKDTFFLRQQQTTKVGIVLQDLNYTYDPVGNITHTHDLAQQTLFFRNQIVDPRNEYFYDSLYHLVAATGREHLGLANGEVNGPTAPSPNDSFHTGLDHPGDGNAVGRYMEIYELDTVGNIRSVRHQTSDERQREWTRAYDYSEPSLIEPSKTSNQVSSTTVGRTSSRYSYDGHGNMSLPHLSRMEWDYRDMLRVTATQRTAEGREPETTFYTYNSHGVRVRKVTERYAGEGQTPTRLKERLYMGNYELYSEFATDGLTKTLGRVTQHINDDKSRIALVELRTLGTEPNIPQSLIKYQLGNILQSVSLELDQNGEIISYEEYTPFGTTSFQSAKAVKGVSKRYKYTAKEHDEESGLSYHGARYYAPWLCRWISSDPALCHGEPENDRKGNAERDKKPTNEDLFRRLSATASPYVYVENRPTIALDPDGRDAVYLLWSGDINGTIPFSGHADLMIINNKTGEARVWAYGQADGIRGRVVEKYLEKTTGKSLLPRLEMGPDGHPVTASLMQLLTVIHEKEEFGSLSLKAVYFESDQWEKMTKWVLNEKAVNDEPGSNWEWGIRPMSRWYLMISNNCADFAANILQQDLKLPHLSFPLTTPITAYLEYTDFWNQKKIIIGGDKSKPPTRRMFNGSTSKFIRQED